MIPSYEQLHTVLLELEKESQRNVKERIISYRHLRHLPEGHLEALFHELREAGPLVVNPWSRPDESPDARGWIVKCFGGKSAVDHTPLRDAARELCDALAERWFSDGGDAEKQTARCVAAHMVLSDLLQGEGGGE